jgi:hypothetical protein
VTTSDLITAAAQLVASCEEMDPESFAERLAEWDAAADDKLAALRAVAVALDAQAAARKAEAEAWRLAAKRSEAQAERVKARAGALLDAAEACGETLKGARWQPNGGAIPLVYAPIFDVNALGFRLQRVTVEPNPDAIRTALERGEDVPGVSLGERGRHVRWTVGGGK